MQITITALSGSSVISDPNPLEGQWTAYVELGSSTNAYVTKNITAGQLERVTPALKTLETAGQIFWSVVSDTTQDLRTEDGTVQPVYVSGMDVTTGAAAGGDTVKIYGAGFLTDFTPATAVTGTTNYITYSSKKGAEGNKVSVAHTQGTGAEELAVTVVGNAISVRIAHDGNTLAQIAAAVNADASASALVIATVTGSGAAAILAQTYLTGGKGSTIAVKVGGKACAITKLTDTELNVVTPALTPLIATNQAVVLAVLGPHTYFCGALTLT